MTGPGTIPQKGTAERWENVARRIRVPLGFATAALYLVELWRHPPISAATGWSLVLVLPGLWLRGYAAGYVKKNRELTQTGPYAYTRNPLYLGSILIAAGFATALLSWVVAVALVAVFLVIYVPVIASEERFLRATFPDFEAYCRRVPRLIPRLRLPQNTTVPSRDKTEVTSGNFSFELYLRHREYNSAIGTALLYLGLVFCGPALAWLGRGLR
jgi:protein-S-isoprenylcysteine O-methyltransferase Ste14